MKNKKVWAFGGALISDYQRNTYPGSDKCIQRVERYEFDVIVEPTTKVTIYREWANQLNKQELNFKTE